MELDIRSIKCSLNMDIIRAKTPAMVRTEIWSCLLAYNLIRMKMLQSCAVSGNMPRCLSYYDDHAVAICQLGVGQRLC